MLLVQTGSLVPALLPQRIPTVALQVLLNHQSHSPSDNGAIGLPGLSPECQALLPAQRGIPSSLLMTMTSTAQLMHTPSIHMTVHALPASWSQRGHLVPSKRQTRMPQSGHFTLALLPLLPHPVLPLHTSRILVHSQAWLRAQSLQPSSVST